MNSSCYCICSTSQKNINFWKDRLKNNDICFEGSTKRFDEDEEPIIRLFDPDDLELELVAHSSAKENDERF